MCWLIGCVVFVLVCCYVVGFVWFVAVACLSVVVFKVCCWCWFGLLVVLSVVCCRFISECVLLYVVTVWGDGLLLLLFKYRAVCSVLVCCVVCCLLLCCVCDCSRVVLIVLGCYVCVCGVFVVAF